MKMCIRDRHRPRAEHRQGVDDGDQCRQQQGIALPPQEKSRQQLTEGDPQQNALGLAPLSQGGQQVRLDASGLPQPVLRQLPPRCV